MARKMRAAMMALVFVAVSTKLRSGLVPVSSADSTASGGDIHAIGEAASFNVYGTAAGQTSKNKATRKLPVGLRGNAPGRNKADGEEPLSFECSNEYPAIAHSTWSHLAEPFRETTMTASPATGEEQTGDIFLWRFEDDRKTMLEGREVKYTFKTLGQQRVSLTHTRVRTGETRQVEAKVMVKYVRREIRQLTEKDREAFFNTLEKLYRIPTSEGIAVYGDDYKGVEFFVEMHLAGAGSKDCDHWHDDAGVMTHHVGFTLLFEQALQVVNPAVSVPYWEYTIEGESSTESYGDSKIFLPDWFGEASPNNQLHTVELGRFAFLPVMQDADDSVHNAYGLLRAPWNLDPSPYVTRHNTTNGQMKTKMVGCSAYAASLESSSLSELNNWLNGGIHGPVHVMVGGQWDDPEQGFVDATGYSAMVMMITKYLWRKGYMRLPEACSFSEKATNIENEKDGGDSSACRASCPAEVYESRGMTPYDVLMDVEALYWTGRFSGGVIEHIEEDDRFVVAGHEDDEEFQSAFWDKMLKSLCDPGYAGELLTASAPYDPLFWVIHPTAERILNWRRIIARSGREKYAFDEAWGYNHGFVVGETGVICDWSGIGEDNLDMPVCSKGICGGHKALDVLPFQVKINGEKREMTNLEWLDFIYPTNEDLPYLYNEYRWDHCVEAGFGLETLTH